MFMKTKLLYIWQDVVGLKDLLTSIFLSVTLTMVGFFLAPSNNQTLQLLLGLVGALLAFFINAKRIQPKRIIQKEVRGDSDK
ncbi:hypothetical protein C7P63_03140 [Vagococcus humatus]|uniref:Uncharacterized protein n=2 Tax=Vagococcus humatus TaxID=1889241 RepID=A0A429Z8S2_9ENTE|nr:hypothetical protein C7P63_03140 [Vagococcus humatus]